MAVTESDPSVVCISLTLFDALACIKPNSITLAGSKLVGDTFEAKFHYAIWFEAGSKLVADRFEAGRRPASN